MVEAGGLDQGQIEHRSEGFRECKAYKNKRFYGPGTFHKPVLKQRMHWQGGSPNGSLPFGFENMADGMSDEATFRESFIQRWRISLDARLSGSGLPRPDCQFESTFLQLRKDTLIGRSLQEDGVFAVTQFLIIHAQYIFVLRGFILNVQIEGLQNYFNSCPSSSRL